MNVFDENINIHLLNCVQLLPFTLRDQSLCICSNSGSACYIYRWLASPPGARDFVCCDAVLF